MLNMNDDITGADVRGPDNDKIGSVGQVYADDDSGQPSWATVTTGFLGTNVSFVPLADASWDGEALRVPYDKAMIKDSPNMDPDTHLSREEEAALYRHYGRDYEGSDVDTSSDGYDASGADTDDAMTRSEERLSVDTQQQEAGRVRLRKYVVTEQQSVSVPVSREEVRVEREPITDANRDAALSGTDISEDEHEVVLHEERPVVTTETEAVERVRLAKETVTDSETVTGEVRKERVEVDGDTTADTGDDDRRV